MKKMENKNHSITRDYVCDKSSTEIHYLVRDEVLGKDWEDKEDFGEITLNQKLHSWAGESSSIKIDDVIQILEELKKEGCNYVEMMHHEDHAGYYFNGLNIHRSTDIEVSDEKERIEKKEKAKKDLAITELELKLEKLRKS